ncbi:hypothetical protein [Methylovulum miyakonense]|uniref:hypothetical protein n=1 Tax=Methylovulum miyakonense TaxID=645578 RepID=UPI00035CB313|nr:hypothetical protein [Methylovulum miyakonense]
MNTLTPRQLHCLLLSLLASLDFDIGHLFNEIEVLKPQYGETEQTNDFTEGAERAKTTLIALYAIASLQTVPKVTASSVETTVASEASRTERFEAFLKCHDADTFAFIDWLVRLCRDGNQEGIDFLENFVIGLYEAASYFMYENQLHTDSDFRGNVIKFLSEIRCHLKGHYHEGAE